MAKFKFFKSVENSLVIEASRKELKGHIYFSEGSAFFRWDTTEGKHVDLYCDKESGTYSLTWFGRVEDVSHQSLTEILTKVRSELLFLEDVINYVMCNSYSSLKEVYNA